MFRRGKERDPICPMPLDQQRRPVGTSIHLLQVDSRVVRLQNLIVGRAVHGHAIGTDLAHTDTVPPATAIEHEADKITRRVSFFVEIEQAVSQTQQRPQPQSANPVSYTHLTLPTSDL